MDSQCCSSLCRPSSSKIFIRRRRQTRSTAQCDDMSRLRHTNDFIPSTGSHTAIEYLLHDNFPHNRSVPNYRMIRIRRYPCFTSILCLLILFLDAATAGMPRFLLMKQRVHDSPDGISQLFLLHKTKHSLRVRRNKPACTADDYSKPGVQEAVFKMIVGGKTSDVAPMVRQMSKLEKSNSGSSGACSEIDESQQGGSGMKLGFDISPDMPLEMRAICSFDYEENIDEKRIPRSIREVKCLCKVPQQTEGIRCEPVYNEVPVLVFDDTCTNFREELQPIAFACVPVLTSQSQSTYTIGIGNGGRNDNVQI